jgi:hypothetical protein
MAAFKPLLFTEKDSKNVQLIEDCVTGTARLLNAAPFRLKFVSALVDAAANRVQATAMVMLAAAITSNSTAANNQFKPRAQQKTQKPCNTRSELKMVGYLLM